MYHQNTSPNTGSDPFSIPQMERWRKKMNIFSDQSAELNEDIRWNEKPTTVVEEVN